MSKSKTINIIYGFHNSPFGIALIGCFDAQVCHISFSDDNKNNWLDNLKAEYQNANFIENYEYSKKFAD